MNTLLVIYLAGVVLAVIPAARGIAKAWELTADNVLGHLAAGVFGTLVAALWPLFLPGVLVGLAIRRTR